jgi:DNA-binding CsgD family transcriptional regulator
MVAHHPVRERAAELKGRRDECDALDDVVAAVRGGESRAVVLRGEPGVGKTALLDHVAAQATGCRVVWVAGVQSEMELVFAGLHQLCAPLLGRLGRLPVPQRDALRTAFGMGAGPVPDRFLVGLAVLGLLSDVGGDEPLICVVDDAQWLDRASAQTLGFVARRLAADPVGLVFAARHVAEELAGLPEIILHGLGDADARALLDSALSGPLDARVRDQIVAETRGNPLALLELPRGVSPAELAGGFGLPVTRPLSGRIEDSFRRQLDGLPPAARRLLQLAAADPSGDPLLVRRAAERLGIGVEAELPAVEAGLVEIGVRVRFRHPLVRSAAYRSASVAARRDLHRALAAATEPLADPDRLAWHRAQATLEPDEDVAAELERSAGRAQVRGGLAAAAAFLERAALLTPDPVRRTWRLLSAAGAERDAGALDTALGLLVAVDAGPLDARQAAEVAGLRGQIAADQRRGGAAELLLSSARRLEPFDVALARETHLEALYAAVWEADAPCRVREAADAADAAPPGRQPPRGVDVLLDALTLRLRQGYAAAAPALRRAGELLRAVEAGSGEGHRWRRRAAGRAGGLAALELWDFDSWSALAEEQVRSARDSGALVTLGLALNYLAVTHLFAGDVDTVARLIDEDRVIREATGSTALTYDAMLLAAWCGRERETAELTDAVSAAAAAQGQGMLADIARYARSMLYNGLGRHAAAQDAARPAFERDRLGLGALLVPELAEAASRTGDRALGAVVLRWLAERTRVAPGDWVLGVAARARALLDDGADADSCHRESIERLGRTRLRGELARAHLLYGEWLRREQRRTEARGQLRTAQDMLDAVGMAAFADRAGRELAATGATARRRTVDDTAALTAQEYRVARLARDGLSNPQIGARLFLSTRTVQYHLSKVFAKLGISSRGQLAASLPC